MKIIRIVTMIAFAMGIFSLGFAAETKRITTIAKIRGTVEVMTPQKTWTTAKVGMVLTEGDFIRTKKNSWALLDLDGAAQTATVELKENSQLKLAKLISDKTAATESTLLDLALGEVLIHAKKLHSDKSRFEVKTPTSVVGVRGTTFSVAVEAIE